MKKTKTPDQLRQEIDKLEQKQNDIRKEIKALKNEILLHAKYKKDQEVFVNINTVYDPDWIKAIIRAVDYDCFTYFCNDKSLQYYYKISIYDYHRKKYQRQIYRMTPHYEKLIKPYKPVEMQSE